MDLPWDNAEQRIAGWLGNDMSKPETWPIETVRWLAAIEREKGCKALHDEVMLFIRSGRGIGRDGGYKWAPPEFRSARSYLGLGGSSLSSIRFTVS